MRLLQILFSIVSIAGYIGNGILFLYIEWSLLRQGFIQVFNPFLHLQVLVILLTNPIFWVFLAMALVGHYVATRLEKHLEQRAMQRSSNVSKTLSKTPLPPQNYQFTFPESWTARREPISPFPSPSSTPIIDEPEAEVIEPQADPVQQSTAPVSELRTSLTDATELLKWAIQSSQTVCFTYYEWAGETGECTVTPISFVEVGQGSCLEGYCHSNRRRRSFEIDRMRDIRVVSEIAPIYICEQTQAETIHRDLYRQIESAPVQSPGPVEEIKRLEEEIQSRERPYITLHIDDLERLVASQWNNSKVLEDLAYELEFRSRRRSHELSKRVADRLRQLEKGLFTWATTTNNPDSHRFSGRDFEDFKEEGVLGHYGYRVGMKGLPENERREILDAIVQRPLLPSIEPAERRAWGEPNSDQRLRKLSERIAFHIRTKRHRANYERAVRDWKNDLAYLKRTYYDNR